MARLLPPEHLPCADDDGAQLLQRLLRLVHHPWTNGQVERMNRTDATIRPWHYDGQDQLQQHLHGFIDACNFARHLKTLNGLTPLSTLANAGLQRKINSLLIPSRKCRG